MDSAGKDEALRAEPGQPVPGLLGAQVSPLQGSVQRALLNVSAAAKEGIGDCRVVRSRGPPKWPVAHRPWPLLPPSLGPPVTSGQS